MTAWTDRVNWPPALRLRIAEFNLEQVDEFVKRAALSSRKRYFSDAGWSKLVEIRTQQADSFSLLWQNRVDLFRDVEAACSEDPAGATGQSLAARWQEHLDVWSNGDPAVKAGLLKAWADWCHWPATLRWLEEGLCLPSGERFDRAADFLDRACVVSQ
jgi:hypothetical protein